MSFLFLSLPDRFVFDSCCMWTVVVCVCSGERGSSLPSITAVEGSWHVHRASAHAHVSSHGHIRSGRVTVLQPYGPALWCGSYSTSYLHWIELFMQLMWIRKTSRCVFSSPAERDRRELSADVRHPQLQAGRNAPQRHTRDPGTSAGRPGICPESSTGRPAFRTGEWKLLFHLKNQNQVLTYWCVFIQSDLLHLTFLFVNILRFWVWTYFCGLFMSIRHVIS